MKIYIIWQKKASTAAGIAPAPSERKVLAGLRVILLPQAVTTPEIDLRKINPSAFRTRCTQPSALVFEMSVKTQGMKSMTTFAQFHTNPNFFKKPHLFLVSNLVVHEIIPKFLQCQLRLLLTLIILNLIEFQP